MMIKAVHIQEILASTGALLLIACAPTANVAAAPVTAPGTAQAAAHAAAQTTSHDVQWARVSAEHRAVYLETYRAAAERLNSLASGHPRGSWGVILDADETVIDNSDYELARVPFGGSYDATAWSAWVAEGRAPALPGAVAFTDRVHQLGGRVVIVTNRNDSQCPVTRANLEHVSIKADLVLCRTTTDDKNPRFDAVQNGSAASSLPAISVLEWVGDNIQDFPHLSQSIRNQPDSAFARFGESFFALPNVMYGSWQATPLR